MKNKFIRNTLFSSLQISIFLFLTSFALDARAEYYMVYPAPVVAPQYVYQCSSCSRCNSCSQCNRCYTRSSCRRSCSNVYYEDYQPIVYMRPVIYMEYVSPRRHQPQYGAGEMVEYAWVPYP